ncbi:MAG: flavodoxin domain-containing protein [Candidatus Bathyarchaeota archaeon]|nr:MAG: flavodoxin domain-containing protein [Candidatus Bathyarchaeum tardum]WNZ29721.1 MAG: flavodoxin domain-containing protein [Candidatus Bathyarchaeota archaeon]
MKRALVLYWSKTGNTKKVALAIKDGLESAGLNVSLMKTTEAENVDYFDYDLVCVGFPSYQWHPPKPVADFLLKKFDAYRKQEQIKKASPTIPEKYALIFCTYSGPHTGLREATPAALYAGQFFEHLGFTVLNEWCVLSEFIGSVEFSTQGRMGDIRGKPTAEELKKLTLDAKELVSGF